MADAEHLRILLEEGVEAWNEWRKKEPGVFSNLRYAGLEGVDLSGADFRDADLGGANLKEANLTKADLWKADLEAANLEGVQLTNANLTIAVLTHANLTRADLTSANLTKANLTKADLGGADLTNADLTRANLMNANLGSAVLREAGLREADLMGANLGEADLREADLTKADLREAGLEEADAQGAVAVGAKLESAAVEGAIFVGASLLDVHGLLLDGNQIRGAKFSPRAGDPWSVLRRNYTGTRLLFHLLLLALFVLPYFARILMWAGVNQAQRAIVHSTTTLQVVSDDLQDRGDPNAQALAQVTEQLSQIQPCLAKECKDYYVWQLLLGVDQGAYLWLLAIALITYNLIRAVLTRSVGPLRDEEERTGYAPALKSYLWLFDLHRAASVLIWVATVAFAFNAYKWLTMTVALPV